MRIAVAGIKIEKVGTMNYTKGEWKVNTIKGIRVQNKARCICLVGENDEEDEVNAHLIAAAPDMYEALKECVSWFREEIITKYRADGTIPYLEGYKRGVFALAKAEGKETK